ncbi:MAG: M6 family metalloprotease domain-containing protein, partial [Prevotella sp.]|nr:M6 family metalloprotease domain-containing protein [Prevotella sp.]
FHYYITRDKVPVIASKDAYCYANALGFAMISSGMVAHEASERSEIEMGYIQQLSEVKSVEHFRRMAARKGIARKNMQSARKTMDFQGSKKSIIILVEFSNKTFTGTDVQTYYDNMANQIGYNVNNAPGSVHDFFTDMSRGQFDLTFDVVGPVTVSQRANYYGGQYDGDNSEYQGVRHADELVIEACRLADQQYDINWADYDWNGDGEVEEVFVYYAGYGQATGGSRGTVWPHMGWLSDFGEDVPITIDGVKIDVYACANELYGNSGSRKMGHGTFCHEFSHCLGFPDMYDTSYSGNLGMGEFDIMDLGNYNGPNNMAWCPAGYTSWERYMAGWLELEELLPDDTIRGLRPLVEDTAKAYVIYNDAYKDEFYTLENRVKKSWDKYIPSEGLLITHVDYDKVLFDNNIVNTELSASEAGQYGLPANDHERMSSFKLVDTTYYHNWFTDEDEQEISLKDATYPLQNGVDSLTDNSIPMAILYNAGPDNTKLMHKPIYGIEFDSDKNISFVFMPKEKEDPQLTEIVNVGYAVRNKIIVYNLDGVKIAESDNLDTLSLPSGIYIAIQNDGKARKIIIK